MKRLSLVSRFTIGCALLLLLPSLVSAQIQTYQTFVSAVRGNDANPCTVTAPCRTFGRAIQLASYGGQVVAVDSGDYPPFTVNKAVTVQAADGIYAGITATSQGGGNAITVNAPGSDVVTLRRLTLFGFGSLAQAGINFASGNALHVEHCFVRAAVQAGILATGSGNLFVVDSIISDASQAGIWFSPNSDNAKATVDHCRITRSGTGLFVTRGVATARNSVFAENFAEGIVVARITSGIAELNAENCAITNNELGVHVEQANTTFRISDSIVTDNITYGILQFNGALALSRGNNTIEGNGTDVYGTLGLYSPK